MLMELVQKSWGTEQSDRQMKLRKMIAVFVVSELELENQKDSKMSLFLEVTYTFTHLRSFLVVQ